MESFEYLRLLINENRFEKANEEYWGGADVIFITPKEYERKPDRKKNLDKWNDESDCHNLIINDIVPQVIWLIEKLRPYVNVDYLTKYKYYKKIAKEVEKYNPQKTSVTEFLNLLLDKLTDWEIGYFNPTGYEKLKSWYEYGIKTNDPFFIKFMALWIYFNHQYRIYAEYEDKNSNICYRNERDQITCWCQKNKNKLLKKMDKVFSSPFIKIFLNSPLKEYKGNDKFIATKKRKENHTNLIYGTEEEKIIALFQTLYTVRCNLFHGSKDTGDINDVNLVQNSGEILELLLEK